MSSVSSLLEEISAVHSLLGFWRKTIFVQVFFFRCCLKGAQRWISGYRKAALIWKALESKLS